MSIIASAKVPAGSRLIDADTIAFPRQVVSGPCPPWCTDDHTNDPTDIHGFLLGQVHERVFAELTGEHPAWVREQSTAAVYVESTTEAGEVTTPARVVLSIARGSEGRHPGEQDCEAWTGTPDEVRKLAAVLMLAADLLDQQ